MWIARADLDALRVELAAARERVAVLAEQTVTQRTQTAFLMARVNQLEKERAIMLRHITKLEIPVPELTAVAAAPIDTKDLVAAMGSGMFEDMGDAAARSERVGWDEHGHVQYDTPAPAHGR